MHFRKIFSLKVVSGTVDGFVDFLLSSKPKKPRVVTALSMNEFLQIPSETLKKIDYLTPDGMPMVWLMRMIDSRSKRIYGPDVMEKVLEKSAQTNKRHYFYGSSQNVLESLISKIRKTYPDLKIVGYESPPFNEMTTNEEKEYFSRIEKSKPDFVWIGLGGKKQAETSLRLRKFLKHNVYIMPVGAAFDFFSGSKPQSPEILQKVGLEWLFRLISEPGRLWKRYVLQIPVFLVLWFVEALKIIFSNKENRKLSP